MKKIQNYLLVGLICLSISVNPASCVFQDAMHSFEQECLGDEVFSCKDGQCIRIEQYCDGDKDCDDGSDEMFCPNSTVTACKEGLAQICNDSSECLPLSAVCDQQKDCLDNSDEVGCNYHQHVVSNGTCSGFQCAGGPCISWLWVCDGLADCPDKSDELDKNLCSETSPNRAVELNPTNCDYQPKKLGYYTCLDHSYCVLQNRMCDGLTDCRDGSDEGDFCKNWSTMCDSHKCPVGSFCRRERTGPACTCKDDQLKYNVTSNNCDDLDECQDLLPRCSQTCTNKAPGFTCSCALGYKAGARDAKLCYALTTEPLLFYSTPTEIRYLLPSSKKEFIVLKNLVEPHGLSFDGKYVYWLEKRDGHRAVSRADITKNNVTREVIASFGLGMPGGLAVNWLQEQVYFTDLQHGTITVCRLTAPMCSQLHIADSHHPHSIVLDPAHGRMYWVDWNHRTKIMQGNMDGSSASILLSDIQHYPTSMALDAVSGRLYFSDSTSVQGIKLDGKHDKAFVLFNSSFQKPHQVSVFENSVYFSDLVYDTLQSVDKVRPSTQRHGILRGLNQTVLSLFLYHPLLMPVQKHACTSNPCSDLCLLAGDSFRCACQYGMKLRKDGRTCYLPPGSPPPEYMVMVSGGTLSRVRTDAGAVGNPDLTPRPLSRVETARAAAFDSNNRILYIYDAARRAILYITMEDLAKGSNQTTTLLDKDLEDVRDMDYDYIAGLLYFLDSARKTIEAVSRTSGHRATIHKFSNQELPISFCVCMDYGRLLVAVAHHVSVKKEIRIDAIGLDGRDRVPLFNTHFKGPVVRLRYLRHKDTVVMSDEETGQIDTFHPYGSGREKFVRTSTSINQIAITEQSVFWTDRKSNRLFWTNIDDVHYYTRSMEISIFPRHQQVILQATYGILSPNDPLLQHPCHRVNDTCSHLCVQVKHPTILEAPLHFYMGYRCICPTDMILVGSHCEVPKKCQRNEVYCWKDNSCVSGSRCDGVDNCHGKEDEEECEERNVKLVCAEDQKVCDGVCVAKSTYCNSTDVLLPGYRCPPETWECATNAICIERWEVCNGIADCPDHSDESKEACRNIHCDDIEFTCLSGSCIFKGWRCDGSPDCMDGSDEIGCSKKQCTAGQFLCTNGECIGKERRCDGQADCLDFSDEDSCFADDEDYDAESKECDYNEFRCEYNTSICLPLTARCNNRIECPGGTDEQGCKLLCPRHMFQCRTENFCVKLEHVCDGDVECRDGSDEEPWACARNNITTTSPATKVPTSSARPSCVNMFMCASTQCVEWSQVCDGAQNCGDGTDEGPLCASACDKSPCQYSCRATPQGPVCTCPVGWTLRTHDDQQRCEDIDECASMPCSQLCHNLPGSFICECTPGYALRSDRRSCKAIGNTMTILFVEGPSIKAMTRGDEVTDYYEDRNGLITDIQYDFAYKTIYTATKYGITESKPSKLETYLTNVGVPTKLTLDWVSGNLYFVDSSSRPLVIRVCHFVSKHCADLFALPSSDLELTAMAVDPANRNLFFCLTNGTTYDSTINRSDLDGLNMQSLAPVRNCSAIAADSYDRRLYVATPTVVYQINYDGSRLMPNHYDARLKPPPDRLTIVESSYYFVIPKTRLFVRCPLDVNAQCTTYSLPPMHAAPPHTVAIVHAGVQRHDVLDVCVHVREGCGGVCVAGVCVCAGGRRIQGEGCNHVGHYREGHFTTSNQLEPSVAGQVAEIIIVCGVVALSVIALYCLYCRKNTGFNNEQTVVFRNLMGDVEGDEEQILWGDDLSSEAKVHPMSKSSPRGADDAEQPGVYKEPGRGDKEGYGRSTSSEEAANPIQHLQNLWRRSWFAGSLRGRRTASIPRTTLEQVSSSTSAPSSDEQLAVSPPGQLAIYGVPSSNEESQL